MVSHRLSLVSGATALRPEEAAPAVETNPLERLKATLVGRYTVERELGAGGMALVYLAHDVRHNRKVAVKVLRPELSAVLGAKRFLQEIEVTANLQHPHIVPLFDSGEAAGFLYYVMPYVEGESLRVLLARDGKLSISDSVRILREVADAIAYAHGRGVVHRDIKPDNVMVSGRHASVTDFGIARAVSEAAGKEGLTTIGMAVGTPAYMAPEQAAADPALDHRADIYALGVLGYEMLTGLPPFRGSPQKVLAAHLKGEITPPSSVRPDVPPALEQVLTRALARDPADRWERCEEIVHQLESLVTPKSGTLALRAARRPARRVIIGAGVGVVAVVAALLTTFGLKQGMLVSDTVSATSIAVFPFSVRGGPEVEYLGEGIVNLLATSMDGAGQLRSVDPRAVMAVAPQSRVRSITPEEASGLARQLGAGLYIRGDILQAGNNIRIDAALYDLARGSDPVGSGTADGDPSEVLDLVDEVASELLGSGAAGAGSRVTQVAAVTTSSLSALKAYLEGEHEFRAGRFAAAIRAFQEAVSADSQFALGFYRLSIAAEWGLRPDIATRAAEGAVRHAGRLSDHDRRLLDALLAHRRGDADEAERLFRAVTAIWPQDVEAWIQLAEVQFHYGPLEGRRLSESRPSFERVLELEPDNALALIHLQRIAASSGNDAAVDSLGRRILKLNPDGDRALEVRAYLVLQSDDESRLRDFFAELDRAPETVVPEAVFGASIWLDRPTALEQFLQRETLPTRSPEMRALGHVHLAYLHASRGRWSDAVAEFQRAEQLNEAMGLVHRAFVTLQPFTPASRGELERMRNTLTAWNADRARPSAIPTAHFNIHDGLHGALKTYLLGHTDVQLGNVARATARAAELERVTGDSVGAVLRRTFGRSVRAAVAEAKGDSMEALRVLGDGRLTVNYELALFSPIISRAADRYRRAILLDAKGEVDQALLGYSSFRDFNFLDQVFSAPAALHAGRLAERSGRAAEARSHYQRFLFFWEEADRDFQPLVDEARSALARLSGEGFESN